MLAGVRSRPAASLPAAPAPGAEAGAGADNRLDMSTAPEALPAAAYTALGERHYRSSVLTRGPWHPEHQHAGPPIALVCREILHAAQAHGLTHLARITANLLRPVPIAELTVEVMTDYAGRNAAHFSAHLWAGSKDVGRFTALVQREVPVTLPPGLPGHPLPAMLPPPEDCPVARFPFAGRHVGYSDLVETRSARGTIFQGPAAIWFRLRHPLVEGDAAGTTPPVAVFADSGNGISAVLDIRHYSFVNSDLTINLVRPPVGEWIGLDARSLVGPAGGGLAESVLYDTQGLIGRATQSLAVRVHPG